MTDKSNHAVILALETGTPVCSVALQTQSGDIIEKKAEGNGIHSEKTFLFIEELLNGQNYSFEDVSSVLINNGPGSYTGLRIGASAAKGLLFDKKSDLYAVQSLASIAMGSISEANEFCNIHSVINARRTHLYYQRFSVENKKLQPLTEPAVLHIDSIADLCEPDDILTGTGINRLEINNLNCRVFESSDVISAVNMITLFNADKEGVFTAKVNAVSFEPLYQLD